MRGSRTTSLTLPQAPAFGSQTPKTSRDTRARTRAPAHMAQGSRVTYNTVSSRCREPTAETAWRIAIISACAVGSRVDSTRLEPRPIILSPLTSTAPTGTSAAPAALSANSTASLIQCRSSPSLSAASDVIVRLPPCPGTAAEGAGEEGFQRGVNIIGPAHGFNSVEGGAQPSNARVEPSWRNSYDCSRVQN